MSTKNLSLHTKADIHRASLLQICPCFVRDIERAVNLIDDPNWKLRWKVKLTFDTNGEHVLLSAFYGQGVVDISRDLSVPQEGLEELFTGWDILDYIPGGIYRGVSEIDPPSVGRPKIPTIQRFHAFDPTLVILHHLCGLGWNDALNWIQRERYNYYKKNKFKISDDCNNDPTENYNSMKKRTTCLERELKESSVTTDDIPANLRFPPKGQYTDVNKLTKRDRRPENVIDIAKPVNSKDRTFKQDWDKDPTTICVLEAALALVQNSGNLQEFPRLVDAAIAQLQKIVKNKTWKGLWPLSPVLPADFGVIWEDREDWEAWERASEEYDSLYPRLGIFF